MVSSVHGHINRIQINRIQINRITDSLFMEVLTLQLFPIQPLIAGNIHTSKTLTIKPGKGMAISHCNISMVNPHLIHPYIQAPLSEPQQTQILSHIRKDSISLIHCNTLHLLIKILAHPFIEHSHMNNQVFCLHFHLLQLRFSLFYTRKSKTKCKINPQKTSLLLAFLPYVQLTCQST